MTFSQVRRRAIGVASLDPGAYEDLRDDPAATVYAVGIVVIATVLAAVGGLLWAAISATPPPIFDVDVPRFVLRSVVLGSIFQVALWVAWVAMTWFFLRYVFLHEDLQLQPLVRTMGFAFAPMALQILIVIPVLEFPIGLIAIGATVGCSVFAVRAASGATPGQAWLATVAGFVLFALGLGLLGMSDADLAPGIFALDPNAVSVALKIDPTSGR